MILAEESSITQQSRFWQGDAHWTAGRAKNRSGKWGDAE